jgi:hypothetical protein
MSKVEIEVEGRRSSLCPPLAIGWYLNPNYFVRCNYEQLPVEEDEKMPGTFQHGKCHDQKREAHSLIQCDSKRVSMATQKTLGSF